jgi:hypothetical protein
MSGRSNVSQSGTLRVTLAVQSIQLLDELALLGIYGRNGADVAARFVDERLRDFIERPILKIRRQARG